MILGTGDIGFLIHKDSWMSRVIAWFMGSRWSHTFLVVEKGVFCTWVSETTETIICTGILNNYLDDIEVEMEIFRPKITPGEKHKVVERCLENHGKWYAYIQFISQGIRLLLKKIGIKIPNFLPYGLQCNSHVLTGYCLTSIPGLEGIVPQSVDTEELYQIVRSSEYFERVY